MDPEIESIQEPGESPQSQQRAEPYSISDLPLQILYPEIEAIQERGDQSSQSQQRAEPYSSIPHRSLQINPEIESIQEPGESSQSRQRAKPGSIFRAPAHIKYTKQSDLEPKFVSIGPYYHGQENLRPMEDLKLYIALNILEVPRHQDGSLNTEPFSEFVEPARQTYKEGFDFDDDKFGRMLVLDSCFIIQIMLSFSNNIEKCIRLLDVSITEVRADLLLLENQIPLFFIKEVYMLLKLRAFEAHKLSARTEKFETMLAQFLFSNMPWEYNFTANQSSRAADHLLDLYWKCSSLTEITQKKKQSASWADLHLARFYDIPNATELHQKVGIKFDTLEDPFSRKGYPPKTIVTFSKGILKMPSLKMHSRQKRLLVNLIAYENSMPLRSRFFSCYIKLMDSLIDSKKDVELLQQYGVLRNTLSSHEMAATFFNDIGDFCVVNNRSNIFSGVYMDVQRYYESKWNRQWMNLRNKYLSSPWAGISVGAGVVLLVLTIVQTVYTIRQTAYTIKAYENPPGQG